MQLLRLNENLLGWDCDTLIVMYNDESKTFKTIWELEEYLDHRFGVLIVNEESLTDDNIH
ncbi:hypothetical protein [Amphritea balenae]|uniref:Uncharacterized protein n=1 Tax=Amphritea balenae TaxID=452629 RepID=A0A3P1STE9_9GAMM|nr:hypothetical protein [Amphritea balenae]RRD00477.1 hypothetical protein EHS89_05125 [Amphritea balenae]GGK70453.1 hypothetical protein GCM10007941_20840 [Amphritea balenae]